MNNKGFSLIELVVAGSLGSLLIFSLYSVIHTSSRLSLYQGRLSQTEGDMVFATRLIQKVGRVASQCRVPAGTNSIECLVDFSRPAAGLNQWVRFILVQVPGGPSRLEYQWDDNNNSFFTGFTTRYRWDGIQAFTVCDVPSMNPATLPGTCDIAPIALSNLANQYLTASGKQSRFFRYRVTSAPIQSGNGQMDVTKVLQGSFYRRNPSPLGVAYQW